MDSEPSAEARNLARLLRWMGGFVAFPALTTSLAFWVFEGFGRHALHIVGLGAAGIVGVAAMAAASRLGARWAGDADAGAS